MSTRQIMSGKKVLVTGAGTGIGKGIAIEFARQGADVAFHYGRSADGALAAVKEVQSWGVKATALNADFGQLEQVMQLCNKAADFLGGVDVLVNSAGITMNLPFEQVMPEQFEKLYNVNVRAPFFLTQRALPYMLKQGRGVIINITSIHAFSGLQEHSVYAGTRGAIVSFTRQLAMELAPKNIRVNAIAPGPVMVENHYKVIKNYDPSAAHKNIPAGFIAQPADIAGVAVFLASDAARYILGQTLIVDGGVTSFMPIGLGIGQPMDRKFGTGYVPGL